jgi:hypothetical protein
VHECYKRLPGTWDSGYPTLLHIVGSYAFYNADEGVFALRLQ